MTEQPCARFPDRCPNLRDVPASPSHGGGIRCGCNDLDPRQPAYDAVLAYIREQPHDFLPTTIVDRNALIWRAVHTALDAMGVPSKEGS